jgi:hypothetical protein
MIQRVRDWLYEREIDRLGKACAEAYEAGDKAKATHFFRGMQRAISERSPDQVARMERRMGLHPRTAIKRNVMGAFLRGWLPAGVVAAAFRIFKLRGL